MGSARKHTSNNNKGKPPPQLRSRTTRSSKARLLTSASPAASTALLSTQLRALGLYAADTLGDGNCLFRALSDQLYGSPSRHMELRGRVCDWIEGHRERYEPFVEDERGLEVHLRCMREHGTYGGHMELSAFAHLTRRNVKVIQPGLVYVIEWAAFATPPSSPATAKSTSARHLYQYHDDYDEEGDEDAREDDDDDEDDEGEDDERDRRHRRHDRVRDAPKPKPSKHAPPPQETEGDTIYVAYHDWEHFSSIRNLRGPHNGLPVVREVPPPEDVASAPTQGKPSSSKHSAPAAPASPKKTITKKKVTLKLGSGSGASGSGSGSSVKEEEKDPAGVPLPASRAASPFVGPSGVLEGTGAGGHPLRASYLPTSSTSSSSSSSSSSTSTHTHSDTLPQFSHSQPHPHHQQEHPKHTHAHARTTPSPKRALELDDPGDDSECSSESKRSRTGLRYQHSRAESHDTDTNAPSPPPSSISTTSTLTSASLSSSSTSTTTSSDSPASADSPPSPSSLSPLTSPASSPEPEPSPSPPSPRKTWAEEKPLTRRQRKALGLPKPRSALRGGVGVGAGKIVIPGGRFKRPGVVKEEVGNGEEGDKEWVRNGAGRVDVRGFRELKI
ncbi:hypothetical protein DXG03_005750 [Asterophora parasitica]|uniref:OTU domain-containing protein n=1 Tax=Asterophora parasitica TaxID=117018 RepID=A0A9P7G649_9AGAR|nr:hypothetical protein DXG03_005750 [Asterophora parasitica]